jgi:hypothetical protein
VWGRRDPTLPKTANIGDTAANMFTPKLAILPKPQLKLWSELAKTPSMFTLYEDTAIALRLGHRSSVDFDFFASAPFAPADLIATIPYLASATPRRSAANTLTVTVEREGPVQLSYFGGLQLGQVSAAEPVVGPGFSVASLLDLAGMKAAVVTQRAETKDYLDIHAAPCIGVCGSLELNSAALSLTNWCPRPWSGRCGRPIGPVAPGSAAAAADRSDRDRASTRRS